MEDVRGRMEKMGNDVLWGIRGGGNRRHDPENERERKEQICGKISDPPSLLYSLGPRNGEERGGVTFPFLPSPSPKWAFLLLFQPTEEEEEEKRREKWSSRKKARDFPENNK